MRPKLAAFQISGFGNEIHFDLGIINIPRRLAPLCPLNKNVYFKKYLASNLPVSDIKLLNDPILL